MLKKQLVIYIAITLIISPLYGFIPSAKASGCQGCCSYHGGINYSSPCDRYTGMVKCQDGTASPSCKCSCLLDKNSSIPSTSTSDGGSGGSSEAIAAGVGLAFMLGGLVAVIAKDKRKATFQAYAKRIQKLINKKQENEVFDNLKLGKFFKRYNSCSIKVSENIWIEKPNKLESRLIKRKTRKLEKNIYKLKTAENSKKSLYMRIFKDGEAILQDFNLKKILCIGSFTKKSKFRKLKMYCPSTPKFCSFQYLHYSGTTEYIQSQK